MADSSPNSSGLLLNPNTYDPQQFDDETRRLLRALIDWFEARGKTKLLKDDLEATWVTDFLEFIRVCRRRPQQTLGYLSQRRAQ
jgi:acyl-CoA dehydrogenase